MAQATDLSFLNEAINKLPTDYVIVCNSNEYLASGDTYKDRRILRFEIIEKGKVYVMPNPLITDEQILDLHGTGR